MAWVLIRLKGRLLRNAVGTDTARQLALAGSIVLGGTAALFGFLALFSVRLSATNGPAIATVGCAAVLVGWLLFPLLGFGSDETLDPARLAPFPIPRRSLMLGLFGASLVGIPAVATVVALAGGVAGYGGGLATPFVVATMLALLAVCVTGSRAMVTALAGMLRSRRGRDSMLLGALVTALMFVAVTWLMPRGAADPEETARNLRAAAAAIRVTPFGWAGDALVAARDGRYGTAALEIAGLLALAAAFTWAWSRALDRAVTTVAAAPEPTARAGRGHDVRPAVLRGVLPYGPLGAVAARELRYLFRDPRRRAMLVSAVAMSAMVPVMGLGTGFLGGAFLLPVVAFNLANPNAFGIDGRPWWLHVASGLPPRLELAGRNLALACHAPVVLAVPTAAMVALGTPPAHAAAGYVLALAALGVVTAFANLASVRAPFPVPESSNPWGTQNNSGCAPALWNLAATLAATVLLTPSVLLVVLGGPVLDVAGLVLAVAVGGGTWWAGVTIAARDLERRAPEVLAAVDPRRA